MNLPPELEPTGEMNIILPGNIAVALPVCRPVFPLWDGPPVNFDYGKKPIVNYKNEPCFAELAILRLLSEYKWDGVWVETYGGTHYLRTMPSGWTLKSEHVSIPNDQEKFLRSIWKTAKTTACFDVFAWQGNQVLFCEAKHAGKDRLTAAQVRFIEGVLSCQVSMESLLIVEWTNGPGSQNDRATRK